MRKFKNAAETLDALEEQLALDRSKAKLWETEYRPTSYVVALYRLAETQIDLWAKLGGKPKAPGSYAEYEAQLARFDSHESLGMWIEEQPE